MNQVVLLALNVLGALTIASAIYWFSKLSVQPKQTDSDLRNLFEEWRPKNRQGNGQTLKVGRLALPTGRRPRAGYTLLPMPTWDGPRLYRTTWSGRCCVR